MLYKTIVLELLQQHPEMYNQLISQRKLSATLDHYANQLKTSHAAWKESLDQARPGSHPSQISSEAMEFALQELEACLRPDSQPTDNEEFSLEAAMTYLRAHTPLA